jgi:RND family efflux transporter MFP subunit
MKRTLLLLLCVVPAAAGCKAKAEGKANLPPAKGEGAPPLPALPDVEDEEDVAPVAGTEGKTIGSLFAHAEAQLAPAVGGTIVKIHVKEDDVVKKGQVVFQLDASDAYLRARAAKTGLDAAKVNLKATRVEYDRMKTMFEQGAVNRAQWDQIQARLEAAEVGVQQAQAGLAMAQKAVSDATVKSPIDGVVTGKYKNEGEMATMMPPTIVLVIQDQATLDLRFRLPEKALATIKKGDAFDARFTSVGVTRQATIARIMPTVDPRTRTIEVIAELANTDAKLRPGLFAEIELKP